MADEADHQTITVEGIIANMDSSMSRTLDCSSPRNPVCAPSSAVSRHDFLAEYRDTNLDDQCPNLMNINEGLFSAHRTAHTNSEPASTHAPPNVNIRPNMAAPMDWQIMQTMIDQNRQMLNQQNKLFTLFANGNQSQSMQTTNDNMSVQLDDEDDRYARTEKSADSPTPAQTAGLDNLIANVAEEEESDTDADDDINDVLASLKEFREGADKTGPKIHTELAKHVMDNFHVRVQEDKAKALAKKYDRPNNCEECFVPKTNDSVWPSLKKKTQDLDAKLQRAQNYQLKAMYPTLQLFDKLFGAASNKKGITHAETVQCLNLTKDAFQLMQVAFTDLSYRRRYLIKFDLKPSYKQLCNDSNEITKNLLGDNLETKMKEIEMSARLSGKLKPTKDSQRPHQNKPYNRPTYGSGSYPNRGGSAFSQTRPYNRGNQSNQSFLGRGRGRRDRKSSH